MEFSWSGLIVGWLLRLGDRSMSNVVVVRLAFGDMRVNKCEGIDFFAVEMIWNVDLNCLH